MSSTLFAKSASDNYTAYQGTGGYDGGIVENWGAAIAVQNTSCMYFTLWSPSETDVSLQGFNLTLVDAQGIANAGLANAALQALALATCTGAICNAAAQTWMPRFGLDPGQQYWLLISPIGTVDQGGTAGLQQIYVLSQSPTDGG